MWAALVFLALSSAVDSAPFQLGENGTVTVTTGDGVLRGRVVTSVWNVTYYSFQGIPYAQAPVGDLRFKSPRPAKPWNGVKDALEAAPYCSQKANDASIKTSEDCLYLNVYLPQVAASALPPQGLTVIVWVHGGAFKYGSGSMDNPGNLMNHSVIMVSFNYRLGALGFFSIEHPNVTSNAALKDQVAALRWVKKNIASFGGNPDDVTVTGESAGAISVDLLSLSPLTEGLFHRSITHSGSALVVAFNPDYNRTREAFLLGKAIGFNGTDVDELLKFLLSATADDVVTAEALVAVEKRYFDTDLSSFPVVDAKVQEGSEVFLPDIPANLLRAGKAHSIPRIIGFNYEEGKDFAAALTQESYDRFNHEPETFIPGALNIKRGTAEAVQVAEKIKSFYFGNSIVSFDTLPQLTHYVSDTFMIHPTHGGALLHLKYGSSPVYIFMFTYDGTLQTDTANTTMKGPAHGADVDYVFSDTVPYNPSPDDLTVIKHFISMWVDFALFGDPSRHETVKWIPATKTNLTYLQLDVDLSLHQDAFKERMDFWDQLFDTYNK